MKNKGNPWNPPYLGARVKFFDQPNDNMVHGDPGRPKNDVFGSVLGGTCANFQKNTGHFFWNLTVAVILAALAAKITQNT